MNAAFVCDRNVGTEPGRGWVVVDQAAERVKVSVGERGLGHDEPSAHLSASLTYAEIAELRDVLNEVLADYEGPTSETYNWTPRPCDACGRTIERQREWAAYSGPYRGRSWFCSRSRWVSFDWHIGCAPEWFKARSW